MKKVYSILLTAALLLGAVICLPFAVSAVEQDGDFRYTVQNGKATITKYSGSETDVTIPSELGGCPVTAIGEKAFRYCSKMTSVVIPESVTTIEEYAFHGCSGLKSIEIPDSVTIIERYAFASCKGATSVKIGSGVTEIGSSAFSSCVGLTEVKIPKGVTVLGSFVFMDCSGLTRVELPDGVEVVGYGAFEYCWALEDIYCLSPKCPKGWENGWLRFCEATVHWGRSMPTTDRMIGELNDNGQIDAADYLLLKRFVLGTFTLTDAQKEVADINGDGAINAMDYMLLKRAVLGTYKIA